jgi:MFS family permease
LHSSDRRNYWLLLAAAFAWGAATAQLNLLAVIWRAGGQGDEAIAAAAASASLAVLAAAIAAGPLIERFGARSILLNGAVVALGGLLILPVTIASPAFSALGRALQGFGFGLALTAGILYAKAASADDDQIRAVGMFTAMFLVPTLFAPAMGEWLLRHYGVISYFATAAAAMACSGLIIGALRQADTPPPANSGGYLRLLRNQRIWLPNTAVAVSGAGYGFASSFLPLMLAEQGVAVGWYFSVFALSLLFTRFIGLSILQRLPVAPLTAIGVGAVTIALVLLAFGATPPTTAVAGLWMGLGYAVIHPTTVEWSSRLYPPAERARPIALINTSFHIGSIVAMQGTGAMLAIGGWPLVLAVLATLSLAVLALIAGTAAWRRTEPRAG